MLHWSRNKEISVRTDRARAEESLVCLDDVQGAIFGPGPQTCSKSLDQIRAEQGSDPS